MVSSNPTPLHVTPSNDDATGEAEKYTDIVLIMISLRNVRKELGKSRPVMIASSIAPMCRFSIVAWKQACPSCRV